MSTRKRKAVYNSQQVTSALLGENTLKVSPNEKDAFGKDVKLVKKPVSEMKTLNYKKTKAEDVVIDLKKGKFRSNSTKNWKLEKFIFHYWARILTE